MRPLITPEPPIDSVRTIREDDLKGPTRASRIWVDDVNSDGKLDLLVGDSVTLISPANGVSEEAFKKQSTDWDKAIQAASSAQRSPPADANAQAKAREALNKLYNRRTEFMNEEMTGFVWLYLQK